MYVNVLLFKVTTNLFPSDPVDGSLLCVAKPQRGDQLVFLPLLN